MFGEPNNDITIMQVLPLTAFGGQNTYSLAQKAPWRALRPNLMVSGKPSEQNTNNIAKLVTVSQLSRPQQMGIGRIQSHPVLLPKTPQEWSQ